MKKFWKQVRAFAADNWQVGLFTLLGVGALILVLTYQLATLVGGVSATEQSIGVVITSQALSPEYILRNPLQLPYLLAAYALQISPFMSAFALRLISVLFALAGAAGFFYVLRKWYSMRIALVGTALFVNSSWFLHTGRFADPAASYLLVPLLIAAVVALQAKARARWVLMAATILGLSMLYVPGLIWFLLPALLLQRRVIIGSLRLQPVWFRVILGIVSAILLSPLVATLVWPITGQTTALHNILGLLGLPTDVPSIGAFFSTAGRTISDIFFYSKAGPVYGPGHLPWLDACTGILIAVGIVQFVRHIRLDRTKMFFIVGVIGLALIATGGPVSAVLLLPFLYLIAVEGLKWLLDLWLSVFPRNPVARGFGVTLAVVLVCAVGTYQLQKYFLAWGHAPETRAVFNKTP